MAILQHIQNRTKRTQDRLHFHEDWRMMLVVAALMTACAISMSGLVHSQYPGVLLFLAGGCVALTIRRDKSAHLPLLVIASFLLGLSLSDYRKQSLPRNTVDRETFISLSGEVVQLDYQVSGPTRLVMRVKATDKLDWLVGQKVRLSVRTDLPTGVTSGDQVELRAVVSSSAGRLVPGGFDFDRHNRFNGIAAQGFAVSPVNITRSQDNRKSFASRLENWRAGLSQRILANLDQPIGGIAVALITGQRQYLEDEAANALRDAGLAHLLAISGLHMGLITGVAFFLIELLFAAIYPVSVRWPPRKLAAVFAWIIGLAYLLVSGMSVSTIRAFAMVSIAILAVLTDRRVISLRSVSIAALIVLVFSPEAIFSIGFQMSFAATIGIVVAYEAYSSTREFDDATSRKSDMTWHSKLLQYLLATAAISLVSQIAIAPIALYHFQTLSIIALVANLLAVPLMAFIVMPAAFIGLLLSLVGLEGLALFPMGVGLAIILEMSEYLASLSFSVLRAGPYPYWILTLTGLLFLILMIFRHRIVVIFCTIAGTIMLLTAGQKPADVLVDGGGTIIAVNGSREMSIIGGRRGAFRDEIWQRYWNLRVGGPVNRLTRACDSRACKTVLHNENLPIAASIIRSHSLETTREACNQGLIVIASYNQRRHCRGNAVFLSVEDIERAGPIALWFNTQKDSVTYRFSNPERLFQPAEQSD